MRKFIDKVAAWFTSFGIDKYLHILAVLIICGIVGQITFFCGAPRILAGCIAVAVGMIAGFTKEFIDARTTHVVDPKDYVADLIGAILFFLIFI